MLWVVPSLVQVIVNFVCVSTWLGPTWLGPRGPDCWSKMIPGYVCDSVSRREQYLNRWTDKGSLPFPKWVGFRQLTESLCRPQKGTKSWSISALLLKPLSSALSLGINFLERGCFPALQSSTNIHPTGFPRFVPGAEYSTELCNLDNSVIYI